MYKKGVPITSSSAAIAADPHGCSLHHAFFGLLDATGTATSSRHHCLPRKLSQERLSSCHVPACEELQALGVQSNPSKEAQAEAPELDRQAETRREDNLHLGDEAEDGDEAQLPRHRHQCQLVGEERVLGDGGGARA
eukprot:CAMPEP_0177521076 /NCGR_PEP_ID=MMETSP0369-20130122/47994_1 /TAXON_ID=447022 ORGANISM="Scrippsiella hangoei-like, Strain SHHI-4" /NCGR_SAMPLE_ID=MMETSP0369 /ASSEMBLY_ACC=CAM_ASM_000364 /LENGTH=136 /DNA_ID=CAMNT_0019000483 /DNA_START=629 /DNA_END=1036 /DNA_ORIENTATION=+